MPTFSPKQKESYLESNARLNFWEGSVRAGKSYAALLRFMKELRYGPDGNYLIAGKSETTILRNIVDELNKITGNAIRYKHGLGTFELFGRKVYCVGANDERASGKIQGATFAGALVDEVTLMPETFFKMLLSRLSTPGAKLFATCNPDSPYHWLKKDYLDRAEELNLVQFKFTMEDNPSLTREYKDNLKSEYQGLWYKRYIEGLWVMAEGAIYDFFDTNLHTVKEAPTYAKYYLLGIDYGTSNPFAAVLLGVNDDVRPALWIEKEYYYDPKVIGHQQTDTEFADCLQREFGDYPIRFYYLDPSAESFEVELKRRQKPVKQASNSVLPGIRFVSSLIAQGDFVIKRRCTDLIKEIEGYVWDPKSVKDGEDEPLKRNDHLVDAMRYVLYSHFGKRKTIKETTAEEVAKTAQQKHYARNPMAYAGFTSSHGWQRM